MGKILKKFPRSIVRQDIKTCRGDRQRMISRAEKASSLQQLFTCMLLFAAVATFLGISLASLLAFLLPDPPLRQASDHPDPRHPPAPVVPRATFQPSRLRQRSLTTRHHAVVVGKMAPPLAPKMEAKENRTPTPPRT